MNMTGTSKGSEGGLLGPWTGIMKSWLPLLPKGSPESIFLTLRSWDTISIASHPITRSGITRSTDAMTSSTICPRVQFSGLNCAGGTGLDLPRILEHDHEEDCDHQGVGREDVPGIRPSCRVLEAAAFLDDPTCSKGSDRCS